jgi:hypothetical protein
LKPFQGWDTKKGGSDISMTWKGFFNMRTSIMKPNRFKEILNNLLVFAFWMFGVVISAAAAPGDITTVAGTGEQGFSGDGGKATEARLMASSGVFVDSKGNLFIADSGNNRIRRVDGQTGIITTVAGIGEKGFSGDGGKATEARLYNPIDVFVDSLGNLFVADYWNHRIRRVDGQTGVITTVAGTGEEGFSSDGGKATEARLYPSDVFVDSLGNLFITDYLNNRVRRVDGQTGVITTVAGTGERGFSGDGGKATQVFGGVSHQRNSKHLKLSRPCIQRRWRGSNAVELHPRN